MNIPALSEAPRRTRTDHGGPGMNQDQVLTWHENWKRAQAAAAVTLAGVRDAEVAARRQVPRPRPATTPPVPAPRVPADRNTAPVAAEVA